MIATRPRRPWLPGIALLSAGIAGCAIFVTPLAGLALLGPAALALVLLFPGAALPAVIAVAAANRLALSWGDAQIRLEILVVLLLFAALVNRMAVRTLTLQALRSPLGWPLALYAGANLVSTLLFAHEKTRGLKLDAEIVAALLCYVVVTALIKNRRNLETAIKTLWVITVIEAALGIMLLLAFVAHLSAYGVQIGDFGLPMAYGTAWEANIFGSFLLGNFFLLLGDYAGGHRSALHSLGLILVVAGIGVSMTRTVWLAFVLGSLLFVAMASRAHGVRTKLFPILAGAPMLALAALVVGSATPLAGRLFDVVNLHSSSAAGRFVIFNAALADWRRHPLFGTGTGSFNFGAAPGQPHPWLPNFLLLTLHDTGVVGVASLVLVVVVFYRVTFAALRRGGPLSPLIAGSIAGFTALLISFQTTSGFWFAYPWIVTAIGITAAGLAWQDT